MLVNKMYGRRVRIAPRGKIERYRGIVDGAVFVWSVECEGGI